MSKLATELPVLLTGCELGAVSSGLLAPPTIIGCGLLLGRVMLSPEWERAASTVGSAAVVLAALLHPAAGLLAWVLLAPFASGLYLRLELGRGIPNLGSHASDGHAAVDADHGRDDRVAPA